MAMLRVGAYSKKFQSLEKERARQAKEQEKANRGKAQLYSKQTALRQKALEEKKRAMVIAEEDRRKKALEERRVAQNEATQRFRSVLGRIRTSAKSQRPNAKRNDQPPFEFYLPNKPKPKGAPTQPKKSTKDSRERPGERVAFGKDVEIKFKPMNGYHPPGQVNGLQQRTPSLDDVLSQIKGERSVTHNDQDPSVSHGRVVIHKMVPDMFPPQGQMQVYTMGRRSSSDPSLNCKKVSPPNGTVSTCTFVRDPSDPSGASQAMSDLHRNVSDENIAFQTVHNSQYSSRVDDDLRVTSPDTPLSLSNESLLNTTEDGPPPFTNLYDSLDSARPHAVFTIDGDEDSQTMGDSGPPAESRSSQSVTGSAASIAQVPLSSGHQQPIYVCEGSNVPSTDSLEEHHQPSKLTESGSTDIHSVVSVPISRIAEQLREAELLEEAKKKPKVVGILKKSTSNASITNSKRVRFADRIETSSVEASSQKSSLNNSNSSVDQARIELWKKVLPNGITTHYIPNSAFTPKMRVSLSSKPSLPSQPAPTHPTNGLTIHVPTPSVDNLPLSPREQSESTTVRKPGPPREGSPTQPKVSTVSVSLNGVTPNPPTGNTVLPMNTLSVGSASRDDPSKQISLEKTPTDDDITKLWNQIKNAFDDNQKVIIPSQVFNFKIEPGGQSRHSSEVSSAGHATNQTLSVTYDQRGNHPLPQNPRRVASADRFYSKPNETSSQKGSAQRQTNLSRPTRYQPNLSAQPAQLLARRGHSHTVTYPVANRQVNGTQPIVQMASTEPDLATRMNGRKAPTALSLEEKRLMMSIDNLNQKIREHMARLPSAPKIQSPISPEPPNFTPEFYPHPPSSPMPPQMHRVTSTHTHSNSQAYNVPKTRNIHRNSKTPTLAVARNPQASDPPRMQSRAHRSMFYNT